MLPTILLTSLLALLSTVNAGEVRVCLPSSKVSNCNNAMNDFERSGVTFTCMAPDGSDDDVVAEIRCLRMIQRREADVTVVGDVELYWANKRYGLVAYVSEDYRDNTGPFSSEDLLDYYSIAVVPKTSAMCSSSESNKFNALKDKRACHTGYRKNAGWDLPVGYLALKNIMPIVEDPENKANTDAYSVSQFFSQVCAPRTTPDGPINDGSGSGKKFEGLCGLCSDDCSENDPYAGYAGALKCLTDGEGDVAFVKHTTPSDETLKNQDDYSLLCASGCQPLSFYKENGCSLGQRPPSALVAREGWGATTDGEAVINIFVSDGDILGKTKGILWSDKTKALTQVGNPKDFETFMKSFDNYDQIYQMGDAGSSSFPSSSPSSSPSGSPSSSSSSSSSGVKNGVVDGGGAAGIAIGCFFGGVFVLAAIMWVVNRKKKSKWDNFNDTQQQQLGAAQGFKETSNPVATGSPVVAASPPANDAARGAMRV